MAAYAQECTAGGGGLKVTHCTVRTCTKSGSRLNEATFASLLQALPALESIELESEQHVSPCGDAHTAVRVARSLAGCQHLHTLILDESFLGAFGVGEADGDSEEDSSDSALEDSHAEASSSESESAELEEEGAGGGGGRH